MTIIAYFLILSPLLASLFCQLSNNKKYLNLILFAEFAIISAISIFFLLKNQQIDNDFAINPISIGLEFVINPAVASFILAITFLKSTILIFYKNEIEKFLDKKNTAFFYSVICLNLFAIIAIFTTNHLINLFFLIEIYAISFFAMFLISPDKKIALLSFNQFLINTVSSLILLLCFVVIYLNFSTFGLKLIAENFLKRENILLFQSLWFFIILSILVKFFPFWLYFKNLKNSQLFAIFFAVYSLFVSANIGFFLILKFNYLFLYNPKNILFILILSILLILYSSYKIISAKHLKIIAINFCLLHFALIFICLTKHSSKIENAIFYYWINFNFICFFIFLFASFLKKEFKTSSIEKIEILAIKNSKILLPLKAVIPFVSCFPFTFLFYANFELLLEILMKKNILLDFLIVFSIILSNFALLIFAFRIINSAFYPKMILDLNYKNNKNQSKYLLLFMALMLVFIVFCVVVKPFKL